VSGQQAKELVKDAKAGPGHDEKTAVAVNCAVSISQTFNTELVQHTAVARRRHCESCGIRVSARCGGGAD
jgi:hypothetical protein